MPDLPQACVCHLSEGRLRLKIPEKRHDAPFFAIVAERLAGWNSIRKVEVNPLTASVLVLFDDLAALFAENADKNDLFSVAIEEFEHEAAKSTGQRAWEAVFAADSALQRWSGGGTDLRSVMFLALLASGVYQLFRGNVSGGAIPMFWYAGEMVHLRDRVADSARSGVAAHGG